MNSFNSTFVTNAAHQSPQDSGHPDLYKGVEIRDLFPVYRYKSIQECSPHLFDRGLRLRVTDVAHILRSKRDHGSTVALKALDNIEHTGFLGRRHVCVQTTARIVDGELLVLTQRSIRARSKEGLFRKVDSLRKSGSLHPCRHLSSSMPGCGFILTRPDLSSETFARIYLRYGYFMTMSANIPHVKRCPYCYTECSVVCGRLSGTGRKPGDYIMNILVVHNLGDGTSAEESKWLRLAAPCPFGAIRFPRPGFFGHDFITPFLSAGVLTGEEEIGFPTTSPHQGFIKETIDRIDKGLGSLMLVTLLLKQALGPRADSASRSL